MCLGCSGGVCHVEVCACCCLYWEKVTMAVLIIPAMDVGLRGGV